MKNIKMKVVALIAILLIFSSISTSYATDMTSDPQIKTRGIVFNTGIASDQIRLIKDFFRAREEKNVPWGYIYDARTKELVRAFQREKGLKVDGIAGNATINKMNQDIRDKRYNIGLRIPYTDISGDMILINKSSNTLYFLRDGKIQDSYPVATGKTTELTPNGKFTIIRKFKNPRWGGAGISDPIEGGLPENPLGTRWIGISYGGGGKYGVHGNASPRSIGSYASLGCVRMFNRDVEALYDKVKMNTPIWMGPESALESYGVKFKSNYIPRPEKPKVEPKPEPISINIKLNGEQLKLENPVINKDGTTYHPFREILESIGAIVVWDEDNKKAIGILGERHVEFQVNSNEYLDSEGYKYLPKGKEVFISKDKTYVPIRNLMESLGYEVSWEQATATVIIESKIEEIIEDEDIFEEEKEIIEGEEKMQEDLIEDSEVKDELTEEFERIRKQIMEEYDLIED